MNLFVNSEHVHFVTIIYKCFVISFIFTKYVVYNDNTTTANSITTVTASESTTDPSTEGFEGAYLHNGKPKLKKIIATNDIYHCVLR